MRTAIVLILFAVSLSASEAHRTARRAMDEAKRTTNPIRLLVLGMQIRDSLGEALRAEPENVQVRLDRLDVELVHDAIHRRANNGMPDVEPFGQPGRYGHARQPSAAAQCAHLA